MMIAKQDNNAIYITQRTLFTMEGLLYYLPESAALALLASVCRVAASGSQVQSSNSTFFAQLDVNPRLVAKK
jgi:O-methyltransferase involved in polyketide biosynthesis